MTLEFTTCSLCDDELFLQEAMDLNEGISEEPVYLCAGCYNNIKQKAKQIEDEIMLEAHKAQEREDISLREMEEKYCVD